MSDGNFNRNLLPYNNYRSGLRAGQARTQQHALQILEQLLDDHLADRLAPEERTHLLTDFRSRLANAIA